MVKHYDLGGNYVGEFTTVAVNQAIGLDWDQSENLYVSSFAGDLVRKFDITGVDQGFFINSNLLGPTNIWFDSNGDLLVAEYKGTAVKRFDSNGNYLGDFLTGLNKCEGVAIYPNGSILIGNGGNSSVKLFDSTGTYLVEFIASSSGNLLNPNAIVIRTTNSTGITEPNESLLSLFQSNIGTQFQIHPELIERLDYIEVYDISGKLIHRESVKQSTWEANNIAEGKYVVKATFKNGQTISEKIIVTK